MFVGNGGSRDVYVARLGPLGILLIGLMVGILFAFMLVLLLGAFLIWIPFVGLLVAGILWGGRRRKGNFIRCI
jgi:hypothetical protein